MSWPSRDVWPRPVLWVQFSGIHLINAANAVSRSEGRWPGSQSQAILAYSRWPADIATGLESAWNLPVPLLDHNCRNNRHYDSDSGSYGNSDAEAYLQTSFYNMHLAPHLTCKCLVHLKYLHKNIVSVVDTKLGGLIEQGITLPLLCRRNGLYQGLIETLSYPSR
jgi:hypothetical protein